MCSSFSDFRKYDPGSDAYCACTSLNHFPQIVVAGNTFLYIAFFFCIGRCEFFTWFSYLPFLSCFLLNSYISPLSDPFQIVYTNSLLATLNARKMIRVAGEAIQTTSENLSVSLREFPKNGPTMVNYLFLFIMVPRLRTNPFVNKSQLLNFTATNQHFNQNRHNSRIRWRF